MLKLPSEQVRIQKLMMSSMHDACLIVQGTTFGFGVRHVTIDAATGPLHDKLTAL
jgi:hypothetical protein